MKIAFIVDPLDSFNLKKDSTYAIMREAAARGHQLFTMQQDDLAWHKQSVIGRAFYVMEFCDGRVLWDPLLPDIAVADRAAYYRVRVETLAKLHRVDYAAIGLGDFGREVCCRCVGLGAGCSAAGW